MDFINVKDMAMANIQAFETPCVKGTFNIGSGDSITLNLLAEIFKKVFDAKETGENYIVPAHDIYS